jgi:hypothetical protein
MCVSCRVQFIEYIKNNINLYYFRNVILLSTTTIANFSKGELVFDKTKSISPYVRKKIA